MATPGFGFSVGDILAGLHVVRKLIKALNDTAGSRPAYRKLISELLTLEEALAGIQALQVVDPTQAAQKIALEQVAQQCQRSIEEFLTRNAKFKSSLGDAPRPSPSLLSAWRSNLHKVQWALCKESEIEGLRTEIAAHATTLNLMLSTIQLSATKLQSSAIDECARLAIAARDDGDETKALAKKNNQLLNTQADLIVSISSTVAKLSSREQTTELQVLVQKVLESNMKVFNTVLQIQQLQANLPPQVERQQPILFEDAHERLTPFHLEFINSFAAFQAVLEVRFSQVPGLKKVKGMEYALQDTTRKKALDLSRPWESIFRPGRKVIMSILFQQVKTTVSSCPGCLKEDVQNGDGEGDTHIQCSNPDCGLWYRRVTEAKPVKRRQAEEQGQRSVKRRRVDMQTEEDEVRDFRRVQIMQEDREPAVSPTPVTDRTRTLGQTPSDQSSLPDALRGSLHRNEQEHHENGFSRERSTTQKRGHEHTASDGGAARPEVNVLGLHPSSSPTTNISLTDSALKRPLRNPQRLPPSETFARLARPSTKLDRTMADIYADALYNPNVAITPASLSRPGQASRAPSDELFAQRLQAVNDQHLGRNQSTSALQRDSWPFRHGSPLAPSPQPIAHPEATREPVGQEGSRQAPLQNLEDLTGSGAAEGLQPSLFSSNPRAFEPNSHLHSLPSAVPDLVPPPLPPPRFVPFDYPVLDYEEDPWYEFQ